MRTTIAILLAFMVFRMVVNVMIEHVEEDIRRSILNSFNDKPKRDQFKVFHFLYEKKYDLNTEEALMRYKIFKANLKFIKETNEKNLSYTLAVNHFADFTDEEFKTGLIDSEEEMEDFLKAHEEKDNDFDLMADEDEKTPGQIKIDFDLMADEDEIVYNKSDTKTEQLQQQKKIRINWLNSMNPVRSQGKCGNNYAFTILSAIESNYNLEFGNSPDFSEQELTDCDTFNFGCKGGNSITSIKYILKNGIDLEKDYPYSSGKTEKQGECLKTNTQKNFVVESYHYCQKCTRRDFYSMLEKGPIVVYLDIDSNIDKFKFYSKGVIENLKCEKRTHEVVLYGTDYDKKGQYLIARNSWGSYWGENGDFRIRVNEKDKTCLMESTALLPFVKKIKNQIPKKRDSECLKLYSECDLKGSIKEICSNTQIIEDFSLFAGFDIGKFSHVKVFFKSEYCTGPYYNLKQSYPCLNEKNFPNLKNNVKSLIVEEPIIPNGCIWLFEDNCLTGEKLEMCNDVSDLNSLNFGNRISSIAFEIGVKSVSIFLYPNFQGTFGNILANIAGMYGSWMDNDIESIKII